ncbi:MAG: hypothetical protein GXO87_02835 [Chlorobi bacterium]|nr:hypothetical protein [Chlorobiota bacterium]
MSKIKKEYEAKLDGKNRLTVKEAQYSYYQVSEFDDGTVLLKPRVLVDPETISEDTLKMIDKSMKNFSKGKVSQKINVEKYIKAVDSFDEV